MASDPEDPRILAFRRLMQVIDRLRGPDGCPWDRDQSLASVAPHTIEEAYEAADAMASGDRGEACAELGDLLMNVLLACRIAEDAGDFSLQDSAEAITDKLVRRHPHVFERTPVDGKHEVLKNWEAIKREERAGDQDTSALAGVPSSLPALLRAFRVGDKAAHVGFEWPDVSGALEKLEEELGELKDAMAGSDQRAIADELGDVLFAVVNVARHVGAEPETALRRTVSKFDGRFRFVESRLRQDGRATTDASLHEMEQLWEASKEQLSTWGEFIPESAPDEWRRAVRNLVKARERVFDLTRDVPPDLAARAPGAGVSGWSVESVLAHLMLVDELVARELTRALDRAEQQGNLAPFPPEGLAQHPPARTFVLPQENVAAPDGVLPKERVSRASAFDRLRASQRALLELLPRVIGIHPRDIRVRHPQLGELDILQWFDFVAQHDGRHAGQIARILDSFASGKPREGRAQ